MTAEIAVLNRSAVAMAADSAVTLSSSDPRSAVSKIFQNENKLFELSKNYPIGLMIYNATSFFDVPWEVIIKDFRNDVGSDSCDDVFAWADKFRTYVVNHAIFKPSDEKQRDFFRLLLDSEFGRVLQDWQHDTLPLALSRQTQRVRRSYPEILDKKIENRTRLYESHSFFNGFDEARSVEGLAAYEDVFSDAVSERFGNLPLFPNQREDLRRLARAVLSRSRPGWFTTGLVFAGYGSKELFPSLVCLELGSFLSGDLRWIQKQRVDIDRSKVTAEIMPFAQRESVDTLLFGRANSYERRIVEHFAKALRQVGNGLVTELTGRGNKRKDFEQRVEATVASVLRNFDERHSQQLKDGFARDTLDIVRHMPKADLAAFAESLVTVSSMMRKVSVGPETVGGPVNVAVISRHEGFIWVKRKLYFGAELNQRYMWRAAKAAK